MLMEQTNTANPFPVKFSHREIPVMKTGVPAMGTGVHCIGDRVFPVWKTSQGKPCTGPVLALYGIAVHRIIKDSRLMICLIHTDFVLEHKINFSKAISLIILLKICFLWK